MDWQDPTKHGFYRPLKKMPGSFTDADKQRLTTAAQESLEANVLSAIPRFSAERIRPSLF